MSQLTTRVRVGPGGKITISIPPDIADENSDVEITVKNLTQQADDRDEWLEFIRTTAGSITDPTFVRHPQGELPERNLFQ